MHVEQTHIDLVLRSLLGYLWPTIAVNPKSVESAHVIAMLINKSDNFPTADPDCWATRCHNRLVVRVPRNDELPGLFARFKREYETRTTCRPGGFAPGAPPHVDSED